MSVQSVIAEFTDTKDRVTAAEVAAYLITRIREEIALNDDEYDDSLLKPVAWKGATTYARDEMKTKRKLEAILNGDGQGNMFPEDFSEFICLGDDEMTWARRRALTQAEYDRALGFLETKSAQLVAKIDRYRADYNTALPCWAPGLTFIEAYRLATQAA